MMIIIETKIIAKKVIKTVKVDSVIENSDGIAKIRPVTPTSETPIVAQRTRVGGMHRVTKFKNPV